MRARRAARPSGPRAAARRDGAAALRAAVARWAARIGVRPRRVQVQPMTTKWASCSRAGRLSFSHDLLREPPAFQEAVIVHELLHLQVPNHGRLFRSLLAAYLPGEAREPSGQNGAPGRCVWGRER